MTLIFLSCASWFVAVYHLAVRLPPEQAKTWAEEQMKEASFFIPKASAGVNHMILHGNAYQRGLADGLLMKKTLHRQEDLLFSEYDKFFPRVLTRKIFEVLAMRWFWGVDRFMDEDFKAYSYGVAKNASTKYDHIIDPYTRQGAFHGSHEVGQFFVDVERDDFGCTQFVIPQNPGFLIGRNFDFEAGRLFDEEKVVKWNFPSKGLPFVSIAWSGFAGVITGVNQSGVYVAINAAGSADLKRYGNISTFVVREALQFSKTAQEAVRRISEANVFITDIYVVADQKNAYRVEKTPKVTKVISIQQPAVVTNHLQHPHFANDSVNQWRRNQLTSLARQRRGQQLLREVGSDQDVDAPMMLSWLRDRRGANGSELHLGNRAAIDALIATHGFIFDAPKGHIYVSTGPALIGAFLGYDLNASFAAGTPIQVSTLPADDRTSEEEFYRLKQSLKTLSRARQLVKSGECQRANSLLSQAKNLYKKHSLYHLTEGELAACLGRTSLARQHWLDAMKLKPAYAGQRKLLKERLL